MRDLPALRLLLLLVATTALCTLPTPAAAGDAPSIETVNGGILILSPTLTLRDPLGVRADLDMMNVAAEIISFRSLFASMNATIGSLQAAVGWSVF